MSFSLWASGLAAGVAFLTVVMAPLLETAARVVA